MANAIVATARHSTARLLMSSEQSKDRTARVLTLSMK